MIKKKIIFAFIILMVLVMPLISAGFGDVKSFDSKVGVYGKITIKENFGLGSKIWEAELTKNTNVCGSKCSSEIPITIYEEGTLIDGIIFYDLKKNGELSNKNYNPNFKIHKPIIVNDYKWECKLTGEKYKNGTEINDCKSNLVGNHIEYTNEPYFIGQRVPAGTYNIILTGTKQPYESLDWQILTNGFYTTEWAVWGNISSGGTAQVFLNTPVNNFGTFTNPNTFNCSALSIATNAVVGPDVIYVENTGFSLSLGGVDSSELAMKFVANVNGKLNSADVFTIGASSAGDCWIFNGSSYSAGTKQYLGTWVNLATSAHCVFTPPFNLIAGNSYWMAMDGSHIERSNTAVAYPVNKTTVNFTSFWAAGWNEQPTWSKNWYGVNVTTASTSYIPKGVNNLTLVINGINNKTVTNLTGGQNLSLSIPLNLGSTFQWTCVACDETNCGSSVANYTFNWTTFIENSQTYNATSYSGNTEHFGINITYDSTLYTSISGVLVYNGVNYLGTTSDTGSNVIFSASKITPTITTPTSYPFYWNITLTNSSGNNYFISKNYSQSVNRVIFGFCNATHNVTFINFSIRDAQSPASILNATFKSYWTIGDSTNNLSIEDLTEKNSSFAFCVTPYDTTIKVSAQIVYASTGYSQNYYYLNNATLTNSTTAISLYLLNDSEAILTELQVLDRSQLPITDVYIQIQLYDPGTNTYYTVANAKTNYNGKDIVYLNWYDSLYKFILTKDGQVIKTTTPYKISSTPQTFYVYDTTTNYPYDKFGDVLYSLTYNNLTSNFILTYTDPSGLITSSCLRVVKRNLKDETLICNQCETSSSATIYCNVAAYGNGTFIATYYALGSLAQIETLVKIIGLTSTIFSKLGLTDGSLYAFLFGGIILGLFFISPVIAVIGSILGIFASISLGFMPFSNSIAYTAFIGIVLIGGIIIWFLRR